MFDDSFDTSTKETTTLSYQPTDTCDDDEGFHKFLPGELIKGRYSVFSFAGKGVFSSVLRARDLCSEDSREVVIKVIKRNHVMLKAGNSEVKILTELTKKDPKCRGHCVHLLDSFAYLGHLCIVLDSHKMNLRQVIKKFGGKTGLNLKAVKVYSRQILIALRTLKKSGIIHADLKPDNMLVSAAQNSLYVCDFGSALKAGESSLTPYLVSRYYRAPEVILGLPYSFEIDMWSAACCFYELYTGSFLFNGQTNNQMLKAHMDLLGPVPKRLLKKAHFASLHFDENYVFMHVEYNKITDKTSVTRLEIAKPAFDLLSKLRSSSSVEDVKNNRVDLFYDLLLSMLNFDPNKRISVSNALKHPFLIS
ncbi:serine/threonine-protein kinase PRP4 homolog [Zophobas morio]|uniref:serine/threonine-protein kinase PRP4 homolog n=1 Tax=Zophobas morio TaxID=2755281 RepID=UPI003082DADA